MRWVSCLVLMVLVASPAWADDPTPIDVATIGDSWANLWPADLAAVLTEHGYAPTIHNLGIFGSTAQMWSDDDLGVRTWATAYLLLHPEIHWVVMSMGGNDLLGEYQVGGDLGDAVFDRVDEDRRAVLDEILSVRPDLNIYLNGYDFLNFEMTPLCAVLGAELLGGTTYDKNKMMEKLTQGAAGIAADYPQVYASSLLGVLQEAGGMNPAPNFFEPSPAVYFDGTDCVHPYNGGYYVLAEAIWGDFFGPLTAPTTTTTTVTTTTTTVPADDDADDDTGWTDDDSDDDDIDDGADDDADDDSTGDDTDDTVDANASDGNSTGCGC